MIIYTEKGIGLHEVIGSAGHTLTCINGTWVSDDDASVQAIIDTYTLADAQSIIRAKISSHARHLRDTAVAEVSPAEIASWAIKRAEAAAYVTSGNPADALMLAVEAGARGITLDAIVARVQGNAAGLATLEAMIGGAEGRHRDAVSELKTFDAVLSYDYSTGWPV